MKLFEYTLVRFLITGSVCIVVYYSVYAGMVEVLQIHYLAASTGGFFAYWIVNYTLNRYWTFRGVAHSRRRSTQHFSLHAINQLLILLGLYVQVDVFGMHYLLAQLLLSIMFTIESFVVTKMIFKK